MGRDGMGWREVGGNGAGWLEGEGKRWRGMPVGRGATGWNGKGRWNEPVGFCWDVSPRSGLFAKSVLSQSAAHLAMGPVQSCCEASAISSSGVR